MALTNSISFLSTKLPSHCIIFFIILIISHGDSLSFNLSGFSPHMEDIIFENDSLVFPSDPVIQLTRNQADNNLSGSVGRALYAHPVRLWDAKTKALTDFITHFTFVMKALDNDSFGDGIAFFLAPLGSRIPPNSSGGGLGLFTDDQSASDSSKNQIVAVEFDSYKNSWDPDDKHVGILVNSIISVTNVTWKDSIRDGKKANAWVSYNSSTHNLSVFLSYADNPVLGTNSSLWFEIDLRDVLPEWVRVGFSASTGQFVEIHNIHSWSFNSTLEAGDGKEKVNVGLAIGLSCVGLAVLACGFGFFWFVIWRKRSDQREDDEAIDVAMNYEFERGTGPKRFTYRELSRATNGFAESGKLGEGGFGGVYKGQLSEPNGEIAVKKVSRGSRQGKKEYISEVKIISRLRHRNLVQLIGWCHEKSEFLLVYEFLPNGSLDTHLFGSKTMLTWPMRYKIAQGLASALLYLHEEWEQCVVHRDIKSSNVMLDSYFNAKLGDFGLARLVDHELGSQTTVLAGTMGYLAPECVTTGKASKESDIYSFGVVALEIACGRKPVEPRAEESKVRLIEWVWNLYGEGNLLEAVDYRLERDFDERQIECLMTIGLWCCHPDYTMRPSIWQVINVLNLEAPLPSLPSKLPVAMYCLPPMDICNFSYTSSGFTGSDRDRTECSTSCSAYSSKSAGTTQALRKSISDS
ncbi:L-type lectin-domain containing receptor kinase IX.1-like [Carica papaya]|uniref:L-type lectin-domain containing receptor kinase IX.1-like n=1 Tax=Carica papaya TaxID=3649 RepID=UPI000B8CCD3F|nr:L-type lectin-domain containing receptor kinase IX.1-like [Carica papaya]